MDWFSYSQLSEILVQAQFLCQTSRGRYISLYFQSASFATTLHSSKSLILKASYITLLRRCSLDVLCTVSPLLQYLGLFQSSANWKSNPSLGFEIRTRIFLAGNLTKVFINNYRELGLTLWFWSTPLLNRMSQSPHLLTDAIYMQVHVDHWNLTILADSSWSLLLFSSSAAAAAADI